MSRLFIILLGLIGVTIALLVWNHESGVTFGMENEKFGMLMSLGLMATYVGLNFAGVSSQGGKTVRNIALWLAIFVALAAGYQYRAPLQDFASSITMGLVPASPQTTRSSDGGIEVTLGRLDSGHFEADAQINGSSVRFLIDTGASSIVLANHEAKAAGIDMTSLKFAIPVSTANGNALAATTRIDELQIGGIVRRNMNALVASEGALTQSLLGLEFLDTLKSYTVRNDTMVLQD